MTIHTIHEDPKRRRPEPVVLLSLKMGADEAKDMVTMRLEYIRAERVGHTNRIAELEAELRAEREYVAAIDGEESQLLSIDTIVSESANSFERLLTERGGQ